MFKRSTSLLTGLCYAGLGLAPLCGCDKQEAPPAPETAPAQPAAPAVPPPPAPDPKAEAEAKAAEMKKQAREARDKAQAELNEQVETVSTKLGEYKAKIGGHGKKANIKVKKLLNAAEAQVKDLQVDLKALGESGEDKFAEGKERLQKALATATKAIEQLTVGKHK